jgi:hypothetical protein
MKTIKIKCGSCGNSFAKDLREYNRQIKRNRTEFFCTRTCAAIKNNEDNPRKGNPENLRSDNRRDEFTPFRWFVLRAEYRDRNKNYGCDLTIEHLKVLWESQNGKCPFTGLDLILPYDSDGWKEYSPYNASIDRIDNSKGYMQGNVRFISVMANLARQSFSDIQLIEFCKAVAKHEMAT